MNWPLYFFVLIELAFITYIDIKYKKIANLWSLTNIALAIVLFVLFPDVYIFGLAAFQYSIVFILVGFFLFLLKVMGGGDSKFLASFFLIVPLDQQDQVFINLLISTIIIGLIFFIKNTFQNRQKLIESFKQKDMQGVKSCFGTKFAYAPVILITWVLFGISLFKKGI